MDSQAFFIEQRSRKAAAKKFGTDKHAHTLETRTHDTSMLFCHLADGQSLRDIKFVRTGELELPEDRDQEILVDETIRLVGDDTERQYPHPLRAESSSTARTISRAARPGRRTEGGRRSARASRLYKRNPARPSRLYMSPNGFFSAMQGADVHCNRNFVKEEAPPLHGEDGSLARCHQSLHPATRCIKIIGTHTWQQARFLKKA